ncbi:MAG: hypothetical protein PHS32_09350 [Rhodoferax sp.]|uniref:hypothetical protein n=1 Tax=Rhodoferax sp. TaxID=50421 RepID=UPI00262866C0|nr:hypothetical protein [Rhodoferax sp.]MDD5333941.1 hypothetical protein [Rhodoferax sp.]
MKLLLTLATNVVAGVLILILFVAAGFSRGGWPVVALAVTACCLIGLGLSFVSSMGNKNLFWAYGLAYVSLPLLFAYSSGNGARTGEMRLIWTGFLLVIYAACLVGGVLGAKMFSSTKID